MSKSENISNRDRLTSREEDIIDLAAQGLTNEQIAHRIDMTPEKLHATFLCIQMKIGESGLTEKAAKLIAERADRVLRGTNTTSSAVDKLMAATGAKLLTVQAELALLHLALDQIKSTVWAADRDLRLQMVANGHVPPVHAGVSWDVGKTVYEVFKSHDLTHPPIKAHLDALNGIESNVKLEDEFENMMLRTTPMTDGADNEKILGCVGVMNSIRK